MGTQSHLLTVITFLPLFSVAALLVLRSDDHKWIRRIALAASIAEFLVSLVLLRGFDVGDAAFQMQEKYDWIGQTGQAAIHYHIGVDGVSLFLVLLTTFLTPLAILCSWESIQENVKGFFISLLVIETAMIGVFVSLDLFLFFVFWELTLIPMYFMIGMWGHERRIYAAIKFILYTMLGSILMLVAILWLYNEANTFDFPEILSLIQTGQIVFPPHTELLLFGAFFLAFAIKVPLFPLHTWLPDAHTEAPTAGSVILAGVMLKLGTYGILRFCLPLFPHAAQKMAPTVAVLAIIGIIYGALVATVQTDLKRLVAYTSVSHLGFVVLGIFAFNATAIQGAIYQMLNHGVSTGALFLAVGMLYDRRHTHEIKQFGGLATPMPVLMSFFLFIALSSLALPPLNGFIGEFLILIGTFYQGHHAWASWASTGAVLSAIYLLWAYQRVALGDVTVEKNRTLPDASKRERVILVVMALVILFMGLASPLFTKRMAASVDNILEQTNGARDASLHRAPLLCCPAPDSRAAVVRRVSDDAGAAAPAGRQVRQ
ncbi:MAG TPA: NADH-quinone oxidoreductase subunit M [Candidatus Baltobacteraceae bacterium]|nr:NADH-quinone oxidoreductase subunit M [Candidatus Baltobacteraceae bacterium]